MYVALLLKGQEQTQPLHFHMQALRYSVASSGERKHEGDRERPGYQICKGSGGVHTVQRIFRWTETDALVQPIQTRCACSKHCAFESCWLDLCNHAQAPQAAA